VCRSVVQRESGTPLTYQFEPWLMCPAATSSKRASPGRIGRPAASADVQPAGRSAFEARLQIAPEPALYFVPFLFAANSS